MKAEGADQKDDRALPKPGGFDDQGWQEKIRVAKEARVQGQELRKDEAPAFATRRTQLTGKRKG